MTILFDDSQETIDRHDALRIRGADGELLDIAVASVTAAGQVLVWYAPDPLFRHWLGRLQKRDARRWALRMEPYHVDILASIPIASPGR